MRIRRWICLGFLALIIGGCIWLYGFSLAGFDIINISSNKNYQESEERYQACDNIIFDGNASEVSVYYHDEDDILVKYSQDDNNIYSAEVESDTLKISYKYKVKISFFTWYYRPVYAKIYLPRNQVNSLDLKTTTGEIKVNGINAQIIKAAATTGELELKNVAAPTIIVSATTGNIELDHVNGTELSARCTTGQIKIDNAMITNSINAETTTGAIRMNTVTVALLKGTCTTGSVRITELTCPDIDLRVSTGEIRVEIIGQKSDYKITSSTSTGSSNVNSTETGDKRLFVKTSTGSIKVSWR